MPAPTVAKSHQKFADSTNQSSIYARNKIEQVEQQTVDKLTLFYPGFKIMSQVQKLGWRIK